MTDPEPALTSATSPRERRWNPILVFGGVLAVVAGGIWYWGWNVVQGGNPIDLPERATRFGIFRDLVLIERSAESGGPFFLDRFESTRADWFRFEAATGRGSSQGPTEKPSVANRLHPASSISLGEARAFARWRFCRIPRLDEWNYACTQGDAAQFPWGKLMVETWANTHGLGLGRVAQVGSFESGRSASGPYDLIGNVAEWTESVEWPARSVQVLDTSWMRRTVSPRVVLGLSNWLPVWSPQPPEWLCMGVGLPSPQIAYENAFRRIKLPPRLPGTYELSLTPGLTCWLPAWSPRPLEWFIMGEYAELERSALGGHFGTRVGLSSGSFPRPEKMQPGRRSPTTGVRLAASPDGLLCALVESGLDPSEPERRLLRRFLSAPRHRRVLQVAWRWLELRGWLSWHGKSPLLGLLRAELGD